MIFYPKVKAKAPYRQKLDKFKGYNHNLRIGSGEFYEMENLTSDDYPVLSPRAKRGLVYELQDNGYSTGMLFVPGTGLFITINHQEDHSDEEYGALYLLGEDGELSYIVGSLLPGPKSLALMGKDLVIAPDMIGIGIERREKFDLGATMVVDQGTVTIEMCDADGNRYENVIVSNEAPTTNVGYHQLWLCTAAGSVGLKQYEPSTAEWVSIPSTYVRINCDPYRGLADGDGIEISGLTGVAGNLNGSYIATKVAYHGYIMIPGIIYEKYTQDCSEFPIMIERKIPQLDYIVESVNRIWGCKRDTNEIYACKLGDPYNWNCFQGLSTDSWVGNVGTPGEFTGAVVQNGYPIFYKENCKHKVWPSSTGAHQITTVTCNGVEKGSESSLAVLDGTVFYKSSSGIFADDGGGAVEIGHNLGDITYSEATGTVHNRKYYLNMYGEDRKNHLFVYDIARKLWHLEDGIAGFIASGSGSLYSISGGEVWDLTGNTGTLEEDVSWMAVTGDLGLELPEQKYISRLTLRLSLDPGATLEVYAQYDREQEWVKLGQVYGTDLRSFSLPVRPRRCDQLRLKLQGTGMCKLYSITKTLEKGSELS